MSFLLMKYMNTACWPSADFPVQNQGPGIFDCVVFNDMRISTTAWWHVHKKNCWSDENEINVELVCFQGFWSIILLRKPLEGDTNICIKASWQVEVESDK